MRQAVHFVDAQGRVTRGAEAVFSAAAVAGGKRWPRWLYAKAPPFATAAEFAYRLVAANRPAIAAVRRIWYGPDLKPPTYHIAAGVFLRLMGVVYFIAFASLGAQVAGLIGDRGILPASEFLAAVDRHFSQQQPAESPLWHAPTLAWISPHDRLLEVLCTGGAGLALLLIFGIAPLPCLALLWLFYLSLFHVGQTFLSFQWDILLLESGFLAIFAAPLAWRARLCAGRHPPRLALWLVWWLLFRLMFESGAVKLTWNDNLAGAAAAPANSWEMLTALDYHYWTQPLPTWIAWYAAQLPLWWHKLSVLVLFVIELGLPWLIFGPRRLRPIAFAGFAALMALIAATGNYNFFNLLTCALAVTLLDDKCWPRRLRARIAGTDPPALFAPTRLRSFVLVPFAALAIVLGVAQVRDAAFPSNMPEPPLESRLDISQFCLVNDYGLFRRMTETRPEIVIEGSADGAHWQAYEFRWKPGDVSRRPRFVAPHQPRLDWQMWFEALRLEQVEAVTGGLDVRNASPWFQSLLMKLMTGEPQVLGLLGTNPFPANPPKFIRVALYQYRFTDFPERRAMNAWWRRELVRTGPAMSLSLDK